MHHVPVRDSNARRTAHRKCAPPRQSHALSTSQKQSTRRQPRPRTVCRALQLDHSQPLQSTSCGILNTTCWEPCIPLVEHAWLGARPPVWSKLGTSALGTSYTRNWHDECTNGSDVQDRPGPGSSVSGGAGRLEHSRYTFWYNEHCLLSAAPRQRPYAPVRDAENERGENENIEAAPPHVRCMAHKLG
jgi:hypothetical protein